MCRTKGLARQCKSPLWNLDQFLLECLQLLDRITRLESFPDHVRLTLYLLTKLMILESNSGFLNIDLTVEMQADKRQISIGSSLIGPVVKTRWPGSDVKSREAGWAQSLIFTPP